MTHDGVTLVNFYNTVSQFLVMIYRIFGIVEIVLVP